MRRIIILLGILAYVAMLIVLGMMGVKPPRE